jgi:voltage-gated potassium channel
MNEAGHSLLDVRESDASHAPLVDGFESRYRQLQLRCWRVARGPVPRASKLEIASYGVFHLSLVLNIVAVILETEPGWARGSKHVLKIMSLVTMVFISVEYLICLWAVTVFARFSKLGGRALWVVHPVPLCDIAAIASFWTAEGLKLMTDANQHSLRVLRVLRLLRLLRIFELLKLKGVEKSFTRLGRIAERHWQDLSAAMGVMFISLIIIASLMYVVEGSHDENYANFDSIPKSMYWGVITLTTIGYGDIVPKTSLGQAVCCLVGFYAVCVGSIPIGIIGSGFVEELQHEQKARESPAARASANPSLCVQGSESDEVARLRRSLVSITSSEHLGKLRNDDLEELQRALSRAAFATQEFIFKERLPSGWNVE